MKGVGHAWVRHWETSLSALLKPIIISYTNIYGLGVGIRTVFEIFSLLSGVVTVQDSQSGKSFSLILNLAKNVQKSPIKCLKEQNINRKQSVYAYLVANI